MYPSEARDLAGSVAIYMIAILFGLALFVVPIYWLSRPTVVENAGAPVQSVDRALTARSGQRAVSGGQSEAADHRQPGDDRRA